jgi:tRNA A-37 threonylcarbamoyl transferase component Bud32
MMRSTLTTQNQLPRHYGGVAKAIWISLFLLCWVLVLAGMPATYQESALNIDPQLREYFLSVGLPSGFHGIFKIGMDLLSLTVFSLIAGILFWRRTNDWMALFVGMMMMLTAFIYANSTYAEGVFLWAVVFLIALGETSQVTFFYIFPSGKFIPSWFKWLVIPLFLFRYVIWANIYINRVGQGAIEVGIVVLLILVGFGYQVYRFNTQSTPTQRQQTKWLLVGLAFTVPIVAGYIYIVNIGQIFGQMGPDNYFILIGLRILQQIGLFIFPGAITLSILRYKLWDIDLVINRSLVVAAITVMLAIPFAGIFFLADMILKSILPGGQTQISAILAALMVGMLFNPARKQAQDIIDRNFFKLRFNLNELSQAQRPERITNPGLLTGKMLGEYEVLDVIGQGGMGEVYKGYGKGQIVAIKILNERLSREADFRTRFAREAKSTASLDHPNIVRALDFGEQNNLAYLVLEFVEGEELGNLIQREGRLPFERVKPFIDEFASALDYAHSKGFVHRDIKPSNIMVRPGPDGGIHPVLMDFGVAKIQDAQTRLTGTGAVGTIDYMAPEQIAEARGVDNRADIYAMGLILYEILTGERPFKGNAAQVMFAHLKQPAPNPRQIQPDIPDQVAYIIQRALAKKPDDRYPTAGLMKEALLNA